MHAVWIIDSRNNKQSRSLDYLSTCPFSTNVELQVMITARVIMIIRMSWWLSRIIYNINNVSYNVSLGGGKLFQIHLAAQLFYGYVTSSNNPCVVMFVIYCKIKILATIDFVWWCLALVHQITYYHNLYSVPVMPA